MITLDFETRSDVDLRKVGASKYARHPSTYPMCVAIAVDDRPVVLYDYYLGGPFECPPEIVEAVERGDKFHAHNAAFEYEIYRHVCSARWGWPAIPSRLWICSAAACGAAAVPRSLDQACVALGIGGGKDKDGRAAMMQLTKPRRPSKSNPDKYFEDPSKYEAMFAYCIKDVELERELERRIPPLSRDEQELWQIDQRINRRGIPLDIETIEAAIRLDAQFKARCERELETITDGEVKTGRQVAKMLEWLVGQGCNLSSLAKDSVEDALARRGLDRDVLRVLELRQALSRSSTAKLQAMLDRADTDGRVRGVHMFHGANTGRWAGRGIQTQNLPQGSIKAEQIEDVVEAIHAGDVSEFGEVPEVLSSMIRPMIKAPEGSTFVVVDFSAIEARVLAWLAGARGILNVFYGHGKLYEYLATQVHGGSVEDIEKGSSERALGKVIGLALGYGMGVNTFADTCEKWGLEVPRETVELAHSAFRENNPEIPRFWRSLDAAASWAVRDPGSVHRAGAKGNVAYEVVGEWLECTLPNGRKIRYYSPRLQRGEYGLELTYMTVDSVTRAWVRAKTYGGKLCENVVQGVARDALADAIYRLEYAGFGVVMHVHDEVVIETQRPNLAKIERIILDSEPWLEGCPLGVDGFIATRYRK